jgi:hypothetical protein
VTCPTSTIAHTARWDRPLPYLRSQNTARMTSLESDGTTASAVSSTNISRSHEVSPVSGTHKASIAGRGERSVGLQRKLNGDRRPFPGAAVDLDRPAHPVAQPGQTRAARGIGAADAVVAEREVQEGVARCSRVMWACEAWACLVVLVSASDAT